MKKSCVNQKIEIMKAGENNNYYYDKVRKRYRTFVSYKVDKELIRKPIYGKTINDLKYKRREFISNLIINGALITNDDDLTFEEAILNWLKSKIVEVRPSTYDRKEGIVKNHLIPYFKGEYLKDISFTDLKTYINNLPYLEAKRNGKDVYLSYNSAHKIYGELKSFYNDISCCEYPLVERNYMLGINMPKKDKFKPTKSEEDKFLTISEMKIFMRKAFEKDEKGEYIYKNPWVFLFIFNTGVRPGEAIGLKKDCFSEQTKTVEIKRTFTRTMNRDENGNKIKDKNGNSYTNKIVEQVKSERSHRKVYLNDDACLAIIESMKMFPDSDFVFNNKLGKNFTEQSLSRKANKIFENCPELKGKSGLHCFRHSAATALYEKDVPIATICGILGHSSIKITEQVYAHKTNKVYQDAMNTIDGLIDIKEEPY